MSPLPQELCPRIWLELSFVDETYKREARHRDLPNGLTLGGEGAATDHKPLTPHHISIIL
jgi:hypothetical protein